MDMFEISIFEYIKVEARGKLGNSEYHKTSLNYLFDTYVMENHPLTDTITRITKMKLCNTM